MPCSQCIPCRINRRRTWATRILLESLLHDENCFVTLTYADAHLPAGGTVLPRDLQLFLKRLRKIVEPRRFRFYGVGEYGDTTARPHYHVACFGLGPLDHAAVQRAWSERGEALGHTHVGDLNWKSASYIARYTMKKLDEHSQGTNLHPVFARMSNRPGIGKEAGYVLARALPAGFDLPPVVRLEGRNLPIGRYVRAAGRELLDPALVQAARDERSHNASEEVLALFQSALAASPTATPRSVILSLNEGRIIRAEHVATLKPEGKF